ncbi:tetratricopeptide repeat protein [Halomonas saccharevitans]|uniref:TPR repeat n=1 Tax=Halomonas saccharevitans TaxID=416872 RepID=A0A1I6Z287_9GAMM|nr:SEL1-like repeat protein [Halomonas saccharevitans]SFT56850.1 TPR repeat [Halomonas saccharevitans]
MNAVGSTPARRPVARLVRAAVGVGLALAMAGCQGLSSRLPEGGLPPVAVEDWALLAWTWPYEMNHLDWTRVRRARQAVERGDYVGGLARLEEMAADGLPPAHYELAKMYHYGHGVSRDLRRAEGLYHAAIRVNSSIRDNASYNLARLYLTHDALGNHDVLAYRLLQQALPGQRRAEALVQLAALRASGGDGIPVDRQAAEALYREAVRLGSDEALLALAEAYHDGGFLPADADASRDYLARYRTLVNARIAEGEVEAMLDMARLYGPEGRLGPAPERRLAWLVRAAESGSTDGMRRAGELIFVEDPARGFEWLRRAAHRGSVPAMATVGAIRLGAPAALADPVQARFWLEKAVDNRSTSAMTDLGEALLVGETLEPDPARGRALLEAAAQHGEPRALTLLGRAFLEGTGLPQRPRLALGYLQRAHREGDVWGTIELGRLRLSGAEDLPPRPEEGEALLASAVERGETAAMRDLAEAYLAGTALAARPSRAEALLQRAVALGDTTAMARLADAYLNGELGGAGPERALELLEAAADRGDDYAMLLLGRAYRQAPGGLSVDLVASERWLRRAVEAGHPSAPRALRNTLYAQGLAGRVPALIEAAEGGASRCHGGPGEALSDGRGGRRSVRPGRAVARRGRGGRSRRGRPEPRAGLSGRRRAQATCRARAALSGAARRGGRAERGPRSGAGISARGRVRAGSRRRRALPRAAGRSRPCRRGARARPGAAGGARPLS